MKRDEMDLLIGELATKLEFSGWGCVSELEPARVSQLLRLGASVAEPSEEEIEAMARGIYNQQVKVYRFDPDEEAAPDWTNIDIGQREGYIEDATAALLALKDRANV